MFEGRHFTVIPIDGSFLDVLGAETDSLRYDGLTWEEAVTLIELSFTQGFEVVIWLIPEDRQDEQTENAIPKETV